jgi:hypothetical protein
VSIYFKVNVDITQRPSNNTEKESMISQQMEEKYRFEYQEEVSGCKIANIMISSFWALGLADPFPDESTTIDEDNALLG